MSFYAGTQANSNQTDFDLEYAQYGFSIQSSRRPVSVRLRVEHALPLRLSCQNMYFVDVMLCLSCLHVFVLLFGESREDATPAEKPKKKIVHITL